MARIRSIKPAFFTDPDVADLPLSARLTFIGLWTHVDDSGRALDDPRLVKAALWPLDDKHTAKKVDADLAALAKKGRIYRYEAKGKRYLEVVNWEKHQKISHPQPSAIPPPSFTERSGNDPGTEPERSGPDFDFDLEVDREGDSSSSPVSEAPGPGRTPEEEILISQTWRCLALRRLNARGPDQAQVVNVHAWLAKTAGQVAELHRDSPLLEAIEPGMSPEELGRLLEPPSKPAPAAPQPKAFEPPDDSEAVDPETAKARVAELRKGLTVSA